MGNEKIDHESNRYPYCVVWTSIPILTWFYPAIGHMGICTPSGVVHDFAGSYQVNVDNMAFGRPLKTLALDITDIEPISYSQAILKADKEFGRMKDPFHVSMEYAILRTLYKLERFFQSLWILFDIPCWFMFSTKHIFPYIDQQFGSIMTWNTRRLFVIVLFRMLFLPKRDWDLPIN